MNINVKNFGSLIFRNLTHSFHIPHYPSMSTTLKLFQTLQHITCENLLLGNPVITETNCFQARSLYERACLTTVYSDIHFMRGRQRGILIGLDDDADG